MSSEAWLERRMKLLRIVAEANDRGERPDFDSVVATANADRKIAAMDMLNLLEGGHVVGTDVGTLSEPDDWMDLRVTESGRQTLLPR